MGYLNGQTSGFFKTDSLGRTVFFPHGIFGRGRVIENQQEAERIRKWLTWMVGTGFIQGLLLFYLLISQFWWLVLILIFANITVWAAFYALARRYPISEEKLSYREYMKNSAKGSGKAALWTEFVVGLVVTGQMIFVAIFYEWGDAERFVLLSMTVIAGAFTFLQGRMLRQLGRRQ